MYDEEWKRMKLNRIWITCLLLCLPLMAFAESPATPTPQPMEVVWTIITPVPTPVPTPEPTPTAVPLAMRRTGLAASGAMNAALPLLEEGNPFIERYNVLTGSSLKALFKYGVPYFFGGTNAKTLMAKYPEYSSLQAWQSSTFFHAGEWYVYGFDCGGFSQYVQAQQNKSEHPKISVMYSEGRCGRHIICSHKQNYPAWNTLFNTLQYGDYVVGHHGNYNHIMVYMGTLRMYGYTEDELPKLAAYLDYPLVIHSGTNPAYTERMNRYIKESGKNWCKTTDGGVTVSLLSPPWGDSYLESTTTFSLENGATLLVMPMKDYDVFAFTRE